MRLGLTQTDSDMLTVRKVSIAFQTDSKIHLKENFVKNFKYLNTVPFFILFFLFVFQIFCVKFSLKLINFLKRVQITQAPAFNDLCPSQNNL